MVWWKDMKTRAWICGAVQIKAASRQAGVSTASMGKFDERLPGEKAGERGTSSKRQKFDPVSGKAGTELKKVCSSLLTRISSKTCTRAYFDARQCLNNDD